MLLAVAEEGGYASAGLRLHVSHSAIHRQVRLLEEELNEKLVLRKGRSIRITEAGRVLVDLMRRVRQDISVSLRQIRELTDAEAGEIRVGTGTTILVFFLAKVLERFRERHPRVIVHLTTGTSDQILAGLEAGTLDVGVVFSPGELAGKRNLDFELLYREEFVLAVGHRHPLAKRRIASLKDLQRAPFITYSRGSYLRRMIDDLFERAGVHPQSTMELENEEAIGRMIEANMGASLLAKRRATSDRIHYLKIRDCAIYCEARLVVPKSSYTPRAVQEFARMCAEVKATL